ncbi:AAA family ATPase [Nocardioides sp. dk4132]|uniref:ATP-dependent nuclease n=1 Tax=unclassified Nocardioides TaxID=2615069 RepID=UPI001294A99E|nr:MULTISPECIES: AAA family ATPase [unclassified Nocardioides]MQW78196.1 AAA family ATPase [Nocardioides sp. dk4132]QGA07937.1 AAA family ATPase [Nocardioides sp. dk884]
MIRRVRLRRFKQFKDEAVELIPAGVTLIAGGNNSGKSSLLHALAVWEFCRTAIEMERGDETFLASSHRQGLGVGGDEFSPVAVPSLKHLWTNLKTQKEPQDPDGYTLRIRCEWEANGPDQYLEFGLALANDRLFVKVTASNLVAGFRLPVIAYLPPFAGITDRETKVSQAIRRRRTGEGLAGAVLRNLLLDIEQHNSDRRVELRQGKSKISESDLRVLRATDPWELLQQALRTTFGAELVIDPFRDEYHSYIRIDVVKGSLVGHKLSRYPGYNKRDLMVEGSGFLQWLSVYTLATSPDVDVLLLDEPDAHLHPTLQVQMMTSLATLATAGEKQVLVATHSSELLRRWSVDRILQVKAKGRGKFKYLSEDHQKVGLLAGLGSAYAPRIDPIRRAGRVLFLEGGTDERMLSALATRLGRDELDGWPVWCTSAHHKERFQLFRALAEEIPGLVAVSLRDRDDEPINTVGVQLNDQNYPSRDNFFALKWRRRHLESYLVHPDAIARCTGKDPDAVKQELADNFSLAVGTNFTVSDCPDLLMQANGKDILKESTVALLTGSGQEPEDVAMILETGEVCDDLRTFFDRLADLNPSPPEGDTEEQDAEPAAS